MWFHDPGWPARASEALERHRVVQLFETVHRVQPRGRSEAKRASAAAFCRNHRLEIAGATPGYGWAARAEVLAEVPLYDAMIVGGGDTAIFLASCSTMRGWRSALGRLDWMRLLNPACRRHFVAWAGKWGDVVQGQVGYLDQHASTFYHGTRRNRRYLGRRSLIAEFDPNRYIVRCPEGCWQWATDNEVMKQGVRDYFRGREEDDGEVHCREQSRNLLSIPAEARTLTR